ncbi:MAG: TerB family tellurite resistance protein [Planctomycetes bacterium]|nr:TerB family tellurite resistance protein [Planctomycetota bacterium]
MIPMDLLAEYVECQSCRRKYNKDVLSFDPESQRKKIEAEFYRTVKRVMLEMMVADLQIHAAEVESIRQTFAQLTTIELSSEEIRAEAEHVRNESSSLEEILSELAPCLNERAKEIMIRAALIVAMADRAIEEREQALLGRIGQALGMSSAHIRGVLSALLHSESEKENGEPRAG